MRETITEVLSAELGRPVRLAVTVDPSLAAGPARPRTPLRDAGRGRRGPSTGGPRPRRRRRGTTSTRPARPGRAQLRRSTVSATVRLPTTAHRTGASNGYTAAARGRDPRAPERQPTSGRYRRARAPGRGWTTGDSRPRHRSGPGRTRGRRAEPARLNPKYTFETFVIGASNRFAHAAAVAVAEAPAKAYNPLFVYGESGLGKTHLLHAIGHYAHSLYPGVRVRYVNSEEFTNDFINSIRDDKASAFQRRYRDVDVLLIDDIQFLQGKVQTQEEFFHTFNTLHNANKQVVITSDLPPKQLAGFEERMRSPVRVGPHHRRPAARPRDPDRDPAQEGHRRAAPGARRRPGVHRQQDLHEHPRARGRAHPRHGVRQPQPPAGRPVARGDRPQGPHPRGRHPGDHRRDDHGPDRRLLRADDGGPLRVRPAPGSSSTPGRSPCTCAGSSPTCRCRRSASSSAAATTPPSSTPTARSGT